MIMPAGVVVVDETNLNWLFFVEGGAATSGLSTALARENR